MVPWLVQWLIERFDTNVSLFLVAITVSVVGDVYILSSRDTFETRLEQEYQREIKLLTDAVKDLRQELRKARNRGNEALTALKAQQESFTGEIKRLDAEDQRQLDRIDRDITRIENMLFIPQRLPPRQQHHSE